MHLIAEYLENSAQLLLRLLSSSSTVGDVVQTGTYTIDGTPQIPGVIQIEVASDTIKNGEAHIYFTGYWPLPKSLYVTLPDNSQQQVMVTQVVEHTSSLLIDQPLDVITPIALEDRRPGESANLYKPEPTLPPEYPDIWVELSLERTDPVRLGANMTSYPLEYVGGCAGRALSSTQAQVVTDAAPYLSYSPVRLEGQFTNTLVNSNFALSPTWSSPYFDPLPDGWSVTLADPMSMVRFQVAEQGAILPSFTVRYRQRGSDMSNIPPVTIYSPAVINTGETFQVIIAPSLGNAAGRVQLKTADDAIVSPIYPLVAGTPVVATLSVGTHIGRIKIVWDQTRGDGDEQVIQLVAPCFSHYVGGHSWIPTGTTSYADVLSLDNIEFDKPWFLTTGNIRVDGSGDPYSWNLKIGTQDLLKVNGGLLSSDFMTNVTPLSLSSYLSSTNSYRLAWSSQTSFTLFDANGTSFAIPFAVDFSHLAGVATPLAVKLTSYRLNEGSSLAKRWAFLPK